MDLKKRSSKVLAKRCVEIGDRFGRLVVTDKAGRTKQYDRLLLCLCDCGRVVTVRSGHLKNGHTISCGCYAKELIRQRNTIHGKSHLPEHYLWLSMIQRCSNPATKQYAYYGVRGIKVCKRWQASFESFLADVGLRPSPELTLERINNDGNYEPGNVKWATRKEQANNRRSNRRILYKDKLQTMREWAREIGITDAGLFRRLKAGWSIEHTLEK